MFSATTKTLLKMTFLAGLALSLGRAQGLTITTGSQLLPALVGIQYSQTFTATGGSPPYTWSFLGSLPLGLQLQSGVLSGIPATNAQSSFIIRVIDSAGTVITQQETIQIGTANTMTRTGVLAQVAAGASWDTTIYFVNTSSAINGAIVLFRDDSGNPLSLAVTSQQQSIFQTLSGSTFTFVLNPNTTVVVHTTAPAASALQQGWGDVFTTGGIGSFAIFKQSLPSGVVARGTSGLQGQFQPSVVIPYDNTTGNTTSAALVSLSGSPMTVTASVWDENGVSLGTQTLSLGSTAHMAFAIPTQFPGTAGKRGAVRFDNSLNTDPLTALGLSFSSLTGNSFTSVPALLP